MRSWKENFGSFFTNSCDWDSKKTIEIIRKDGMTGEEMVRKAIALVKQYNCSIVKPVEYVPEIVGGKVTFTVECHTLTYRYFYEHGKTYTLHGSEVRECDLQKYEAQFGTRRCIHKGYKKTVLVHRQLERAGSVLSFTTQGTEGGQQTDWKRLLCL